CAWSSQSSPSTGLRIGRISSSETRPGLFTTRPATTPEETALMLISVIDADAREPISSRSALNSASATPRTFLSGGAPPCAGPLWSPEPLSSRRGAGLTTDAPRRPERTTMDRITPCLWFDTEGEEAARFYTSLLPNSRIVDTQYYGEGSDRAGTALTVTFELDGRRYFVLNGGPQYRHSEAFSLQVDCEDQAEVDRLWTTLCEGGEEGPCGW